MKYEQPYGVSDPNAAYINGNPTTGTMGSIPPAASIEYPQREVVEVISRANLRGYKDFSNTLCALASDSDLQQLRKAIEGFISSIFAPGTGGGPTLYVRTDGNDANDGSANDAGHAFKTIQAAFNYAVSRFILGGKTLTIQLGNPGTYVSPIFIPTAIGAISLNGDPGNPTGYIVQASATDIAGRNTGVIVVNGGNLTVSNLRLHSLGGSGSFSVVASQGSAFVALGNVLLSTVDPNGVLLACYYSSTLFLSGNITILTSCAVALSCEAGSNITITSGTTITLGNSGINWSQSFLQAYYNSQITFVLPHGGFLGSPGTATGKTYDAQYNAIINTVGAGTSFLPGTIAGTVSTGSFYV